MKYARVPRLDAPPGRLFAGIDWASADHAVCIVDVAGAVVSRFTAAHTAEGLRTLVRRLARAGVCEVAIERGDGPVWTATEHPSPTALHVVVARDLDELERKIIESELPG